MNKKETKKDVKRKNDVKINKNNEQKISIFWQNNKKLFLGLIIGLIIGLTIMASFIPERISKLKNGEEPIITLGDYSITANDYYENLKGKLDFELLLEDVDKYILDQLYKTDEKMTKDVTTEMNNTIKEYTEYYGYTESDFIKENRLGSKEEFFNILLNNFKRSLYFQDYVRSLITNDDIIKYYNAMPKESEIKYIGTPDENLCKTMLNEVKKGSSYDKVLNKYRSKVTYANLGYVAFDNDKVDNNIIEIMSKIKANSYYTSCITVDGNYSVIFKGKEKEKDPVADLQFRITEKIKADKIKQDNETGNKLYNKSLIELRDENKIKFHDTIIEKAYENFKKQYK